MHNISSLALSLYAYWYAEVKSYLKALLGLNTVSQSPYLGCSLLSLISLETRLSRRRFILNNKTLVFQMPILNTLGRTNEILFSKDDGASPQKHSCTLVFFNGILTNASQSASILYFCFGFLPELMLKAAVISTCECPC